MTTKSSPAPVASQNSHSLALAFDVGHSSIGWSVLTAPDKGRPDILGCGVVLFEKDSALASQRRLHRSQRRHVRATRQRIARLEKLLAYIGVMSPQQLTAKHASGAGHAAPWILAARVLASNGERRLNWAEFWDVMRWYAHNRGYEPIGVDVEEKENQEKRANAKNGMQQAGKTTMAETICAWLGLDPMGDRIASMGNYKRKDAAFERDTVRAEVRRLLVAHKGKLPGIDDDFISALLDQAHALPCPDIKLPKRYTGGLLFGRLAMRYHNRIIGHCPLSGEKLPSKNSPEFYRFRWAMLLANITVAGAADAKLRPLTRDERLILTRDATTRGYFTPAEFRKTVATLTGTNRGNLEQMFMDATAADNLVVDPALRLATSTTIISPLWPHLPASTRKHALNRWRRGRTQTLGDLRIKAAALGHDLNPFDAALTDLCGKPRKRGKKDVPPLTPEEVLGTKFSAPIAEGRAPFARPLLTKAYDEAMIGQHPSAEGGCLFESPDQRRARESRPLDQQTNNHLVRHRLMLLGRLVEHLIADPAYGANDPARITRLVLEVNRDLRTMAGLTAQDVAIEMNERLRNHSQVSKKLEVDGALPPGTRINASLIRKARIADDLDWTCPYTGHEFCPVDLVTRRVDLDHIIPRSLRPSDSLDSLVVTFAPINRWKGARTSWQFVRDEQTKTVPDLPTLQIMDLKRYEKTVQALDKRGHPDDQNRKKRRIERLLLERFEEKAGGFTPGQLTQTSQLSRLGQQVLRRPFEKLPEPPVFVALPGQLTARTRAAWDVLPCLADAAPAVMETTTDTEGREHRTVKHKTEIRGITHLHHALDACVLGLAADRFPNRGDIWRALIERRPSPDQRSQLESLDLGAFDSSGGFRLHDLPEELKTQLSARLAERRVAQHVPADMSGIRVEENTRGVLKRQDGRVYLRQKKRNAAGHLVVNETHEPEGKVIGLPGVNGTEGKLAAINGVRVIADNYGVAILADEKLPPAERFILIPFARVWGQLQALQIRNGGKTPQVWRNGQVLTIPDGNKVGSWRIFSVMGSKGGVTLKLDRVDAINYDDSKGCSGFKTTLALLLSRGTLRLKAKL